MIAVILINTNTNIGDYTTVAGARRAIQRRFSGGGSVVKNEKTKNYKGWETVETWTNTLGEVGVKTSYAIVQR